MQRGRVLQTASCGFEWSILFSFHGLCGGASVESCATCEMLRTNSMAVHHAHVKDLLQKCVAGNASTPHEVLIDQDIQPGRCSRDWSWNFPRICLHSSFA